MECRKCRDNFSALYEGRLAADEAELVRAHLESCVQCGQEYRQFTTVVTALRGLEPVTPPGDLLGDIGVALDQPAQPIAFSRRVVKLGPLIAAAACFAAVFVGLVRHHQQYGTTDLLPDLQHRSVERLGDPPPIAQQRETAAAPAVVAELGQSVSAPTPGVSDESPAVVHTPEPVRGAPAEPRVSSRDAQKTEPDTARPSRIGVQRGTPVPDRRTEATADDHRSVAPLPVLPSEAPPATERHLSGPVAPSAVHTLAGQPDDDRTKYFDLPRAGAGVPSRMLPPASVPDSSRLFVRFIPPPVRQVDQPVACAVVLNSDQDMSEVSVRVEPRRHIRLVGPRDGNIYRGPLTAGVPKQIEFKMIGEQEGTQRMRVSVETPVSGLQAQMEVVLPGFETVTKQTPPSPLGEPITVVFRDSPIRQALLQIAREGNVSLVLGAEVGGHRVNYSCIDTPAGSVIRVLADTYGYEVEFADGTYHIAAPR